MTAQAHSWQARTAWTLAGLSAVLALLDTAIALAWTPRLLSSTVVVVHGWPLVTGAAVGSAVVGALIVSRYPRHRIGWLLCLTGSISSLSLVAEAYSIWVHRYGGPGPTWAWQLSGWVASLIGGGLAVGLLAAVFLLAPDGRLLSRRWRPVLWLDVIGLLAYVVAVLTVRPATVVIDENQDFGAVSEVLASAGIIAIGLSLVGAAGSMVVRQRRAEGEARLQLRWFTLGAVLLTAGLVNLLVVQIVNDGKQTALSSLPLSFTYFLFPVFVAVAVLRHRLYDIDLIVSRAAMVAIATALVAVGYVVVVLAVAGTASGSGVGSSLLSTAVVAIAFQPVRARVVRFAHRVAYGRRAAPYEALADLSRHLGESPDPEQLLPRVAAAAARAVAASSATVTLTVHGAAPLHATWPADAGADASQHGSPPGGAAVVLPILDQAERLGELSVVLPAGRSLRAAERRLLDRLGEQTALAFRNARLAAELAARVAELDMQAAALARSRRRLIDARDAERDRLETAIRLEVMGHLEPLPDDLGRLSQRLSSSPGRRRLEGLADPAVAALEALRAITRGVYPAQLARFGLPAVLARTDAPHSQVRIDDTLVGRRFDDRVEATAYFCFTELTRGHDGEADVWVGIQDDILLLRVTGAPTGNGTLARMRDRVEAVGGEVASDGPTLVVRIPADPAAALAVPP